MIGKTLTVSKAPLEICAKTVNFIYGHTSPQPTAYTLTGFVNGETASVVSGALMLSTNVTATAPVGFYPIGVAVGTLTAANYYFKTTSSGMGVVAVYKAELTITARNEAVICGQTPAPPTAYSLTGFVNGDTASVVSGAPSLTATVTSSKNYSFKGGANGLLRILP